MTTILGAFTKDIPRFAFTFGATAAVFHLILCVFRRLGKYRGRKWFARMTDKAVCLIAAFIATIPLAIGLEARELNVLKMLFFPMAFRCICDMLLAKKIVPKFVFGDVLAYMCATYFMTYCGNFETHSCPPGIQKMADNYSKQTKFEMRTLLASSLTQRRDLAEKYKIIY